MKNKTTFIYLFFIIFFSLYTEGVSAQQRRFRATIISGVNLSQIDGDFQKGYRHKGLNLGLSCAAVFKPNFDISAEMFLNQKGAQPAPTGSPQTSRLYSTVNLNYADMVGLFNFHSFPHKTKDFYRQTIKMGLSYGRLLSSNIEVRYNNINLTEYEQEITKGLIKDDLSFVVGMAWQFTPRLGIMFRHSNSIKRIYEKTKPIPYQAVPSTEREFRYFAPYNFSLQVFYHFISPHKALGVRRNSRNGGGDPLEEL